jgi:4-diphosphocytidyl-2-C-methyl-D-erythritol kinase
MKQFKIKSHAKINIALNVIGKNSKLHNIESIIAFINLHDLITVRQIDKTKHKISFKGKFSKKISKKNTVSKLLMLLDEKNLLNNKKFDVKIIKNIPQQSGMGGGSINASSLLKFFIDKKVIKIKENELLKLTSQIGSDVILGTKPNNLVLSHTGKIKRFYKKKILHTLIVKPNFGCSTKYIFSKVKKFSKPKFNTPKQSMFRVQYLKKLKNDLEQIAFNKHPKLENIKSFLATIPNTEFARMSGSGSSIVAYYQSKRSCEIAYKHFKRKFNNHWCIISKTI